MLYILASSFSSWIMSLLLPGRLEDSSLQQNVTIGRKILSRWSQWHFIERGISACLNIPVKFTWTRVYFVLFRRAKCFPGQSLKHAGNTSGRAPGKTQFIMFWTGSYSIELVETRQQLMWRFAGLNRFQRLILSLHFQLQDMIYLVLRLCKIL